MSRLGIVSTSPKFGHSTDADPVNAPARKHQAIVMEGAAMTGPQPTRCRRFGSLQSRYLAGLAGPPTGFTVPQVAIAVP
jgi:hypothetical protein